MWRKIYFSPLGLLISLLMNLWGRFLSPFMIYGWWDFRGRRFIRTIRFGSTVVFLSRNKIEIGAHCWIGQFCIIDGSNGVVIGRGVQLAGWNGIYSHSSDISGRLLGEKFIHIPAEERIGYRRGKVSIGEYSFLGAGARVLPGVTIGRGAVVAAGAVVKTDVPDFAVVAGVPARVVGSTIDTDLGFFANPDVQQFYFDKSVIEKFVR